ncbi:MAG TPA: hypothetical protein VIO38_17610, partial [Rariglobus sp.]
MLRLVHFTSLAFLLTGVLHSAPAEWRSSLYPDNWRPGLADSSGRFLHDFSFAGYHSGARPIPDVAGPVTDVTKPPYNADASGAI